MAILDGSLPAHVATLPAAPIAASAPAPIAALRRSRRVIDLLRSWLASCRAATPPPASVLRFRRRRRPSRRLDAAAATTVAATRRRRRRRRHRRDAAPPPCRHAPCPHRPLPSPKPPARPPSSPPPLPTPPSAARATEARTPAATANTLPAMSAACCAARRTAIAAPSQSSRTGVSAVGPARRLWTPPKDKTFGILAPAAHLGWWGGRRACWDDRGLRYWTQMDR